MFLNVFWIPVKGDGDTLSLHLSFFYGLCDKYLDYPFKK
jgi:hypothetical protein